MQCLTIGEDEVTKGPVVAGKGLVAGTPGSYQ